MRRFNAIGPCQPMRAQAGKTASEGGHGGCQQTGQSTVQVLVCNLAAAVGDGSG
jgi:hypothetical protein